ncbi:hypothetical protein NCR96_08960 [Helicobacter sp. 14348-15]|uniref:hypothetical protein n=1 Tax=Helicobacter colisuis TaxID=2949739 RepID=UPI00202B9D06|nr:hypothetical protein [Helicobacter colisuis]MCL9821862.1 hypothetical protein [Helicobacter colisuis]
MSVVTEINNIYEFSKVTENEEFKNFANHLKCFCESNKEQTNINDIESFKDLIKKELNDDSKYNESLLYLVETLEKEGFIENEKFYKNFQEHLKANNEELQEGEDLGDTLQSELLVNARLSELKTQQDELESQENNDLNQNDESFAENTQNNQLLDSKEEHQGTRVSPQDMIHYIKDENSIMYPFHKKDTLENPAFLSAFYSHLNTKSNQELEALIEQVRAKNEALRKELKELQQNKENLQNTLQSELQDNANLSEELEQKKKDTKENESTQENVAKEAQAQESQENQTQEPQEQKPQNAYAEMNAKLDEAEKLSGKNDEKQEKIEPQEQQGEKQQPQSSYAKLNATLDEVEKVSAESDEKQKKIRQQYAIKRAQERRAEKENEVESDVAAFEMAMGLTQETQQSQSKVRKQK